MLCGAVPGREQSVRTALACLVEGEQAFPVSAAFGNDRPCYTLTAAIKSQWCLFP